MTFGTVRLPRGLRNLYHRTSVNEYLLQRQALGRVSYSSTSNKATLFSATRFVIKFSMNKNLFLKFAFFFSVTMNFVKNLLTSTGECCEGERDVPLSVQRAWCAFL